VLAEKNLRFTHQSVGLGKSARRRLSLASINFGNRAAVVVGEARELKLSRLH
jgi:hypothetical protein